jgi:hypothetical protein
MKVIIAFHDQYIINIILLIVNTLFIEAFDNLTIKPKKITLAISDQ